jgi:hypothetical protein
MADVSHSLEGTDEDDDQRWDEILLEDYELEPKETRIVKQGRNGSVFSYRVRASSSSKKARLQNTRMH